MRILILSIGFAIALFALASGSCFFLLTKPWVDFSALEYYNPGKPSIVLDCHGREWARFQFDRRAPVSLAQMPQHLVQAFLAAEDHNFFSHHGISYRGILRSGLINLYNRRIVQGASTITQQLVKLLFFDGQRTFKRKIKEQIMALLVERQFTKQHIIQTYLNHVYFGCGIYGVEAASQRFWSKSVSQLTPDESATLAGIVRSPNRYCPLLAKENARKRRNVILKSMSQLAHISQEEYEQWSERSLDLVVQEESCDASHGKESLRLFLENLLGRKSLYTEGYVIHTTLNLDIQRKAQEVFKKQLEAQWSKYSTDFDGALVTLDVKTGGIRALIGGYDFKKSQLNRVYAKRQMGSIFKPLVYVAALQEGTDFSEVELDEPITIKGGPQDWSPQNVNRKFKGAMTLAHALAISNNIISIKTLLRVGAQAVANIAERFHLPGPLHPYPSLALGCVDGSLLDAAAMFNVFANKGVYERPYIVENITDSWGKKIWKHKSLSESLLSWKITSQVGYILRQAVDKIKLQFPQWQLRAEAIGKTGTADSQRTCWFAGSTPTLTTTLYIGRDNNQVLGKNIYAVNTAFPIWLELNANLEHSVTKFTWDPSLAICRIDAITGNNLSPLERARSYDILR
jgi:penicillin-binding protein 1A